MKRITRCILVVALCFIVFSVVSAYATELDPVLPVTTQETTDTMPINQIFGMIQEAAILWIAVFCGIIGAIIKHTITAIDNKYIPSILVCLGIFMVIWVNGWIVTPEVLFSGVCSGALAVWAHQAITQMIAKTKQ